MPVTPMVDERETARRALACLDLTDLNDDTSQDKVLALCDRASGPHGTVAAICIWPRFVAAARARLGRENPVRIATVVNFPAGNGLVSDTVAETAQAIADGADEIDLVIPWHAFADGNEGAVRAMIRAVRLAAPGPVRLKTILETGELKDQQLIRRASEIALEEGADFIKTSTGKVAVNATLEAARIMLTAIRDSGRSAGFKPAGGIRTVADAAAYLALAEEIMGSGWAGPDTFRFGASGLLGDIEAVLSGKATSAAGEAY